MPRKKIEAHLVEKHGKWKWRVIVPKELRNGGPREQYRDTKADANDFIRDLESQRGLPSVPLVTMPVWEQARIYRCLEKLGGSVDKVEAATDFYLKANPSTLVPKTLSEVIAELIEKKRKGGCRDIYLEQMEDVLKSFQRGRDIKPISEVTTDEIEEWVLNDEWSSWTQIGYLGRLNTLFNYAVKKGYLVENPAKKVEKPQEEDAEIGVHPLDNARALLKAGLDLDPEIAFHCAAQMFGFMRDREVKRQAAVDGGKAMLDAELRIPGVRAKTRRNRIIKVTDTLREWAKLGHSLPLRGVRERLDNVRARAGAILLARKRGTTVEEIEKEVDWRARWEAFPFPHDGLRHSCVSASYPVNGSMKTSEWSGHDEDELFRHYRALMGENDAKEWWEELRPQKIKAWSGS